MSNTAMVALPSFGIIRSGAKQAREKAKAKAKAKPEEINKLRQRPTGTTSMAETTSSSRSNPGFGNKMKEPLWQCVQKCGACCKLNKGPTFPSPEEIFDDPADVEQYNSMIGPDGWCVHFEKSTRRCSIYADRPYFCRVEPDIFQALYGIDKKKFNKEACSCCIDTIKAVYGSESEELGNFKHAMWNISSQTH